MMHMTFYWSRQVTLLFDSWKTDSWTSYALTLVSCLLVSIFYQYLEDLRIRIKLIKPSSSEAEQPLLSSSKNLSGKLNPSKLGGAALFGFNSAIGYMLMLAVMSFNGGVFLAIVGGLSAGYLFFRSGDDHVDITVDNPCACA